jgi:hypothetical protein
VVARADGESARDHGGGLRTMGATSP